MISFKGDAILLDVEGTTSSIRYVGDVLFPYARQALESFLARKWDDPETARAKNLIANDLGHQDWAAWLHAARVDDPASRAATDLLVHEVYSQMDRDAKATGLKDLQGSIWQEGFTSEELHAHVYEDTTPCLKLWHDAGLDVRIYSSGSIVAQKLFFGHTIEGNLTPLLNGHYDTTTGPKKEAASYKKIAADMQHAPDKILFLSDVVAELDAAKAAGLHTALLLRPENAPVNADHGHPAIHDFTEIVIER